MVVEAKLGATVADQQLRPYREEARRRASGGPVALVLLTARADSAELRHRAWRPVRWFALLRRWEVTLAAAGDTDPEFARLRAQPVAIRAQDREGLPMIAVPDSVAYYWRDPVNEAALNVLGDAGEVPGDLSLPEAEQFALAARRVRVKFWQLLNGLRAAVWDGAICAACPGARLLSYGEH